MCCYSENLIEIGLVLDVNFLKKYELTMNNLLKDVCFYNQSIKMPIDMKFQKRILEAWN